MNISASTGIQAPLFVNNPPSNLPLPTTNVPLPTTALSQPPLQQLPNQQNAFTPQPFNPAQLPTGIPELGIQKPYLPTVMSTSVGQTQPIAVSSTPTNFSASPPVLSSQPHLSNNIPQPQSTEPQLVNPVTSTHPLSQTTIEGTAVYNNSANSQGSVLQTTMQPVQPVKPPDSIVPKPFSIPDNAIQQTISIN